VTIAELNASTTFPIGLHHLFAFCVRPGFQRVRQEDEKRDKEFWMWWELALKDSKAVESNKQHRRQMSSKTWGQSCS
jgi:hypothetical protein